MEATSVYGIAAGGIFIVLVSVRLISLLLRYTSVVSVWIAIHLIYPYLLGRHRLVGPWTRVSVIGHLIYVAANVFVLCFQPSTIANIGHRAGRLSLINMAVLFAGSPLVYLADIIGVSLRASRRIHRATAWMSGMLLACHVTIMVIMGWGDFNIQKIDNIFAIIVLHLLYRNGIFSSRGRPRALVARLSNEDKKEKGDEKKANQAKKQKATRPVSVLVNLSRPMKLDAGQYIYLSLPSLTFWSWLQSHPFTVISWSNQEQDTLELFIQPRRGFSADLLRAAEGGPVSFPAYITGPHGISEPVDQYESVLAIATDFGVAAVIPYFRKLINNRNKSVARARRLHFVWQVQTRDIAIAGQSLLNSLLEHDEDDTLHKHSILTISLFVKSGSSAENMLFLGDHKRAFIHCEEPNYREIIEAEASGQHITSLSNSEEARGESLVMVSATDKLRDEICFIVRDHLADRMRLTELEYQPL
ncbi:hypothetical protein KXW40_005924 [Aspergillus fumigatus]|uniref:ferric-chelate reductase (NADPH) n=1 Tax=Aspergillus fumigatus TaxID=746128 RepID=A0A9P8N992_ASPFM|nr:hypothetical protein KXV57_002561 [Aspergillus fumigatus]KAH2011690.1 hypothetical protein KXV97_009031 [Aspergillus fumigatus]KAH2527630.1 hypothetical protein KXW40_005924 [Aspergillus fumigatus]